MESRSWAVPNDNAGLARRGSKPRLGEWHCPTMWALLSGSTGVKRISVKMKYSVWASLQLLPRFGRDSRSSLAWLFQLLTLAIPYATNLPFKQAMICTSTTELYNSVEIPVAYNYGMRLLMDFGLIFTRRSKSRKSDDSGSTDQCRD